MQMLAAGCCLYLAAACGGQYLMQYMTRQLEITACQQSAHADRRDDGECEALKLKPIALVGISY
jgi:hypothetical protein